MRRRPTPPLAVTGMAALAFIATACGSPAASAAGAPPGAPGTPPPTPVPSVLIASLAPSDEISPGLPSAAPSAATGTLAPPSPTGAVLEDPALLVVLPADLGGVPVVLEPQAFAEAAADPAFATNVDAAAFGVVVDGEDLSSAVVAQLVPGTFSAQFFRDWRESYD